MCIPVKELTPLLHARLSYKLNSYNINSAWEYNLSRSLPVRAFIQQIHMPLTYWPPERTTGSNILVHVILRLYCIHILNLCARVHTDIPYCSLRVLHY